MTVLEFISGVYIYQSNGNYSEQSLEIFLRSLICKQVFFALFWPLYTEERGLLNRVFVSKYSDLYGLDVQDKPKIPMKSEKKFLFSKISS